MTISELLLPEFDQEMKSTRKILECVPEEKFAWKPHEKSMTLGRLCSHTAELAGWTAEAINKDSLDLPVGRKPFQAESRAQLLEAFDKNAAAGHAALASLTDDQVSKIWTLTSAGQTFLSMPRLNVVRSVVMNHLIHHRAQLGVYLRLLDVPFPGVYGPSADDKRS